VRSYGGDAPAVLMSPRLDYLTASRVVHKGPVALQSITIAGDGADGDAQVYDGLDTNGRQILHVEVLTGQTCHIVFPEDVRLEYGIYVVVSAATTKTTIQHKPLGE